MEDVNMSDAANVAPIRDDVNPTVVPAAANSMEIADAANPAPNVTNIFSIFF